MCLPKNRVPPQSDGYPIIMQTHVKFCPEMAISGPGMTTRWDFACRLEGWSGWKTRSPATFGNASKVSWSKDKDTQDPVGPVMMQDLLLKDVGTRGRNWFGGCSSNRTSKKRARTFKRVTAFPGFGPAQSAGRSPNVHKLFGMSQSWEPLQINWMNPLKAHPFCRKTWCFNS